MNSPYRDGSAPLASAVAFALCAAACGGRTELSVAAGETGPHDAGSCDWAPLGDCRATDCADAFQRMCGCGDPPVSPLAGVEFGLPHARQVRWSGGYFLVPFGSPDGPEHRIDVWDHTASRLLRTISGALSGALVPWDGGPIVHVRPAPDRRVTRLLNAVDLNSGETVGPTRTVRQRVLGIGGGDLVVADVPRPGTLQLGLLRAGDEAVQWTTDIAMDSVRDAYGVVVGWDGHLLAVVRGPSVAVYSPYENRVSGPFAHAEGHERVVRAIVPTPSGWLAIWRERVDAFIEDLVFLPLTPEGSARGAGSRWRDPVAAIARPGEWVASHGNEIAVLYGRSLTNCSPRSCGDEELVLLRLDEDGGPLGEPRRIAAGPHEPRGLLWAEYSLAYTENVYDAEGHFAGIQMQRICP